MGDGSPGATQPKSLAANLPPPKPRRYVREPPREVRKRLPAEGC